jgi:ferricrocin synthase
VKASGSSRSILQLQYDAEPGRWSFESSGYVPLVQLRQIAYQLRQAWAEQLGISFEGSDIMLSTANLNPRVLEGPKLLHELPRFQLGEEGLAVEFLTLDGTLHSFSYASIDRLSNSLASRLRCVLQAGRLDGASRSPIVPVLIPQSPELYVALLAILKAGAAFCPLNLDAPEERIKFVVRDVSARVIVTTRALEERFTWQEEHALVVVELSETNHNGHKPIPLPQVDPRGLAYVMYTSGSTGVPKGVSVSHFAATQSLLAHGRHIPPFNRFLQFAAPTFDVFIFEMFFPLFRGSTLVGCARDGLLNDLPGMIGRLRADAAELTPTVVGGLLQKRKNAPGLQVLLTIGEMLTGPIVNEFGGSPTTKGILHGMYGPTEAAIHCTLATNFLAYSRVGIIGVPLDTVSALIIAPQCGPNSVEVLPIGQAGELVIGGHQLADGYLNRPEQTSQSFIETHKYGRLYRTGDRARLLFDGCLEFLGRISTEQVKLRGQRVELGEIEHVACRMDGVGNAAAIVIDEMLVLFCSADIEEVSIKHVLDNCNRWLPKFMIPADVVLVRDLPRLPSGKIDRHRLGSDYIKVRGNALPDLQRPANETERKVRDTVCNLLGRAIGRSTSLATAGLDSLLAIQLSSQLRVLGLSSSAASILKADTIERIWQISSQSTSSTGRDAGTDRQDIFKIARESGHTHLLNLVPIAEASEIIPCTPLQTAMLSETVKDAKAYCNWIELEAHSAIKPVDIRSAFKQLALQNEILRSGFVELKGVHSFGQVIWKDLPDTCFSEVPKFTYEYALDTQLGLLRPLRIQIQERSRSSRVLVQIHHALYDGWSWQQLMGDLECIFAGQKPQNRPPYRKLVEFYHQPSTAASLAISKEFWQRNLRDVIPCTLPSLNGRSGIRSTLDVTGFRTRFSRAELESASRNLLVSPQAYFQGAFAYLLGLYLGHSDVVFGVALSGRTLPLDHIEDIIGPFIATTPFRLDVSNSRTVRDLVQSAHKQSRKNLEHCALPLQDVRRSCGVRPGEVLFDTLLVYQQTLKSNVTEPHFVSQVGGADYLEFSLTLEVEPRTDHIYIRANFRRAIISKGQVEILLEQLDQLVTTFIRSELTSLIDCRSCFHDRVLSIQNPNPQRRRTRTTLASFVEHAAQQCPGDIAIEFYNSIGSRRDVEHLSYGELNIRANQVAHHLISLGVSPDELVCIYMEKSIDFYVSVLAVAKAGAGYLPLTPDMPRDRAQHILVEARVKQCVTHSELWEILGTPEGTSGVCLDTFDFTLLPLSNPSTSYQSSNLAYAVFTSGSTGTPKGVLVTQENLLSNLEVLRDIYSVEIGSRLLQSCSQAFDGEIFLSW